jgi:hypothetical protein
MAMALGPKGHVSDAIFGNLLQLSGEVVMIK